MSDEPLVQVSGLHKRYGAVHAVRGLDLALQRGQILGLLGANGAGKTTSMAMIAGVLAPSAGSIRIAGHDLADDPRAAKSRLGYLPESPPLFPELTVNEFLRHCATVRGVPRTAVDTAVAQSMERCALSDSGRRLLGNLSKGYRQRVGIAQAIVHDPDLIILDEPTSGLDPAQLRDIRSLVRELGREHAVIFSTHLLPEAQQVCDLVHIIHQGQLAMSAPMNALPGNENEFRVRIVDQDHREISVAELSTLRSVSSAQVKSLTSGDATVVCLAEAPAAMNIDTTLASFSRDCAGRGWALLELTAQRPSLEDLFMATAYSAGGGTTLPGDTRG
jgi:ABC-2 type transport system ATP-binding protein